MNVPSPIITLGRMALVLCAIVLLVSCASTPPSAIAPIGPVLAPTNVAATATNALPSGPLQVTVMEAILQGLENNRALQIQRMVPAIQRTYEEQENAAFDPVLAGQLSQQKSLAEQRASGGGAGLTNVEDKTLSGDARLSKTFATGTKVSLGGTTSLDQSPLYANEFDTSRAGISITQSLLKGGRISANLASLRQARLDTLSTEYELRGFAEVLVSQIESTYWDYALAQRQIAIYTDSLKLAEQQLAETRERIAVGKLAENERSTAAAEVAARKAGLINVQSDLEKTRIQLLNLLSPVGTNRFQREIILLDKPEAPQAMLEDVSGHVALALRLRPDLNAARLAIQRGTLEVVKTRNGLLPRLDLFINLGSSGYADSFPASTRNINGDFYDATAGVQFEYPLGNNAAQAQYRRAKLGRDQAAEVLANMEQLAEVDVRSAYVEIGRAREEAVAIAVLVRQRKDTVRSETEKFKVGKSTTLLVAQTQRDLLDSQIQLTETIANYLKSFVNFYRAEGSLLDRRGISAPGGKPVGQP